MGEVQSVLDQGKSVDGVACDGVGASDGEGSAGLELDMRYCVILRVGKKLT